MKPDAAPDEPVPKWRVLASFQSPPTHGFASLIITIVINGVSVLDFVCVKVSQLFQTMQWGVDEMWILGDGKFFRI